MTTKKAPIHKLLKPVKPHEKILSTDTIHIPVQAKNYQDKGLIDYSPERRRSRFISEERIQSIMGELQKWYQHSLQYPDIFLREFLPLDNNFKLYPFQVLTVRTNLRCERNSLTATRGFSKTFVAFLSRYIRGITLPREKMALVAEVKNQATAIAKEKIDEINNLLPGFKRELNLKRGVGNETSNDMFKRVFKNDSTFAVVGVANSARGGRTSSVLLEEARDLPTDLVNAVVIPRLTIARRTSAGLLNVKEPGRQMLLMSSASGTNTFMYTKTIEFLLHSLFNKKFSVMGFSVETPIRYGLITREFVEELRTAESYSPGDYAREFLSKYTNSDEDSLFDFDKLVSLRKIKNAQHEPRHPNDPKFSYYAAVDVARTDARSVVVIFEVEHRSGYWKKRIVNIITLQGRNFLYQSLKIKQLDLLFDFKTIVVDANGLGVGLIDLLAIDNMDPNDQKLYKGLNVVNLKERPEYSREYVQGQKNKIYALKTGGPNLAGNIHTTCFNELFSGHVELLIDEKAKRAELEETSMNFQDKILSLAPYENTSLFVKETSNLRVAKGSNTSKSVQLELIDTGTIKTKDTFSAVEYGLYVIIQDEKEWLEKIRNVDSGWEEYSFIN